MMTGEWQFPGGTSVHPSVDGCAIRRWTNVPTRGHRQANICVGRAEVV